MSDGLAALQQHSSQALVQHYSVAPIWNFALPAGLGYDCVQLGAVAPSCDRVGRYYPVAALLPVPHAQFQATLLDGAGAFYRQLSQALLAAIRHGYTAEQLDGQLASVMSGWPVAHGGGDDILSVLQSPSGSLPCTAWPDLSMYFDRDGTTGFWWTHVGNGAAMQTHVHNGALTNALFSRLFGPQQGSLR